MHRTVGGYDFARCAQVVAAVESVIEFRGHASCFEAGMFKSMFVGACFAMLLTGCPDQNYGRSRGVDVDRERRTTRGRRDQRSTRIPTSKGHDVWVEICS